MTTSTVRARRKGDPQHSVEGNKSKNILKMVFVAKTTAAFSFLGGVQQKGNPSMTTSTVRARRKGDPQHSVEGDKSKTQLKKGPVAKTTAAFSFLEGGPTKKEIQQ